MTSTTMSIRVHVEEDIEHIPADEWAELAHENVYSGPHWLRAMEGEPGHRAYYLTARDTHGRLVGAVPAYLWDGRRAAMAHWYDPHYVFLSRYGGTGDRDRWFPILLIGARSAYLNELPVDERLAPHDAETVASALITECLALAEAERARSVAFMYTTGPTAALVGRLLGDAPVLLSSVDNRLDLPWTSFDEYLAALSRKRRWSARRELAGYEQAGYETTFGRLADCYPEMGSLLANVLRRHGGWETTDTATRYLARLAAELDEHSVLFLCHKDHRLVGFSLYLSWGPKLFSRVVGFDYDRVAPGSSPYFTLEFFAPIRHAIHTGRSFISFGTGTHEAKLLRGASPEPLWSAVLPLAADKADLTALGRWNAEEYARWNDRLEPLLGRLPPEEWRRPRLH